MPLPRLRKIVLALAGLFWAHASAPAQQPAVSATAASEGSYFVAYRTAGHVKYSGPEVFHGIADEIQAFLESKQVVLVSDPERKQFRTTELFSVESLLRLAREAGASHLLYLTVDRPASKWVKITLQCFDRSGKLLWQETTDHGGGFSGKGGVRKALDKMLKKLEVRLDGSDVPRKVPAPSSADPPKER